MLNKKLLLSIIFSCLTYSGMQAMEALSLEEPKENEAHVLNDNDIVTIQLTYNFKQEKEYDKTMYQPKDNDDYNINYEVTVPYKIIKTCSLLRRDISHENTIITIPATDISIEMFKFILDLLNIYSDDQLTNEIKIQKIHELIKNNEEKLFQLLDAANYLNCEPIYNAASHIMTQKLESLIFEKNNLAEALALAKYIKKKTNHYYKIFEYLCDTSKYKTEIKAIVKSIQALEETEIINSICFSPDNKTLAYTRIPNDTAIKLWNISNDEHSSMPKIDNFNIGSINFSHDGTKIASGSWNGNIKICDVNSETCLIDLQGHTTWVTSISFSHDDTKLASASHDNTIKV